MSDSSAPLVVIAIGGNSLIADAEHRSVVDQYQAAGETSRHVAAIVQEGYRVVVTHGNGPQVGFILLRSELAKEVLHQVPLANCVADTQGAIGYQIAQTLRNELLRSGMDRSVVAVMTQVEVDADDPGFLHPTKPIGRFLTEEEARHYADVDGWDVMEDAGRGWRRVVPSPAPRKIVEVLAIRALLEQGAVVVAVGGGGIPVVRTADGLLEGRDAVIDKDAASCLLARELGADVLIISTGVDKVALNFGTPEQRELDQMTVADCRLYMEEGHFAAGSMLPKMEAAINFLEHGGKEVIITQPHHLDGALHGIHGTHISN